MSIHPTAVIEEGASLGADVVVGPHAVIFRHAVIGLRTRIHAGAVIGDAPQDLSFKGGESRVRIGSDCVIREHVTIHRGTKPGSETVVGDHCFLMANSHLGHNVVLGRRVIIANGALLAGHVQVADGVFISGNAVIHQFVRIGRLAMLSGCSAMSKDVPPFCTTRGASLNVIAGLNIVGMRRAGLGAEERLSVKRAFHLLYRAGLNTRQALDRLLTTFPDGPAAEMATFVASSKRGIAGSAYEADAAEEVDASPAPSSMPT